MSSATWRPLTVALIAARDGRHCPHCGTELDLTAQHRGVKGMGGRRSADRPSNGIILCWWANWAAEALADFAAYAIRKGWKISPNDDPERVPVFDATTGRWYRLDDQWGRAELP